MAVYRQIQITFWQDKFVLSLTPEEKFFYLYLLTNSKTKQSGIYEIPIQIIQTETGYNRETVIKLLQRFIDLKKIAYDWEFEELMVLNWIKHNPFKGNKNIQKCIESELKTIHNPSLIPLNSPLQALLQKEKEKKEEETQEEKIRTLWARTFGRTPKLPEYEETEKLLLKFGNEKLYRIYKEATLKGFKNLGTLIDQLDKEGNIKPRNGQEIRKTAEPQMSKELQELKEIDRKRNGH
jgi:hypothetical protein